MTLTCPHCGFSRDLPPNNRPAGPVRVTCPRCRSRFRLQLLPPPSPAAAAVPVPPPVAPSPADRPKAGFWIRVVAALVDWVLITSIETVLSLALFGVAMAMTEGLGSDIQAMGALISWGFGTVLGVAYYVGFTGYCGQTPGKMALRVQVLRCDGSELGYGRALLRETLGKFLSGIILGLGYLMVAFDEQKQGLHDRIADTYVVKL